MGTTRENIIASAMEGAEDPRAMPDIERAARAIATRLGYDPDAEASRYQPRRVNDSVMIIPPRNVIAPLWTFFTAEAEAAISVLGQ